MWGLLTCPGHTSWAHFLGVAFVHHGAWCTFGCALLGALGLLWDFISLKGADATWADLLSVSLTLCIAIESSNFPDFTLTLTVQPSTNFTWNSSKYSISTNYYDNLCNSKPENHTNASHKQCAISSVSYIFSWLQHFHCIVIFFMRNKWLYY